MSARIRIVRRTPSLGVAPEPRSTATTPVPATPTRTSSAVSRAASATFAAVRCSSHASSGCMWRSRRKSVRNDASASVRLARRFRSIGVSVSPWRLDPMSAFGGVWELEAPPDEPDSTGIFGMLPLLAVILRQPSCRWSADENRPSVHGGDNWCHSGQGSIDMDWLRLV